MSPVFEKTLCPWTAENPRHDHQLFFPLKDGRLLFVWCEYYANRPAQVARTPTTKDHQPGDDVPCRISARVSADKGRTWGGRFTLQDNVCKLNVKHPNLLRLPSGEVFFFYTGWDSFEQRNIFLRRSKDDCETWSEPVRISEPGWYCNNNDHIVQLSKGRIVLPAHGVVGGGKFTFQSKLQSFVYYSDDGFQTWKVSADAMTAEGRGCHEPSIVELKDGRLLCLLRTTLGRVYRSYSADRGVHWSKPEATDLRAPDSPPLVKRIPKTGDLLLMWNNVESRTGRPRSPLTAAVSRDEGQTWKHVQNIDGRSTHDSAYASLFFQDNEVLVAYYCRSMTWARDTELMLKAFKVDQFYRGE